MIIQNVDIPSEFDLINGFVLEELEKEIPTTEFIVEQFQDYLDYLDERYRHREPAHRPAWVTEYINLPVDVVTW